MKKTQTKQRSYTVDHEVHDGLGHEVSDGLVDDADVGVHEVADGLHLPLQLGVHGHCVTRIHCVFILRLEETEKKMRWIPKQRCRDFVCACDLMVAPVFAKKIFLS